MSARARARGLVLGAALGLAAAWPAAAHITGVFLYMLQDINGRTNTSSASIIGTQLDETGRRIKALTPQIQAAQARYQTERAAAINELRFYNRFAGGSFASFLAGSHDPVDALANLEILRGLVGRDVSRLQQLAATYQTLQREQDELARWQALLAVFAEAERRHQHVLAASTPSLALFNVSEAWEDIRTGPLLHYVDWAKQRLQDLAAVATPDGAGRWRIDEAQLNARIGGDQLQVDGGTSTDIMSRYLPAQFAALNKAADRIESIRIFLRADHVYVTGLFNVPQGERQVIMVGQMTRANTTAIRYHIEYVLVDGFLIPPTDPQMQQVIKDYTLLPIDGRRLDPHLSSLQFSQDNGGLLVWADH